MKFKFSAEQIFYPVSCIHIYMETSQGYSLGSYLKQKKSQFFSFTKLEDRRTEQLLHWGIGISGRGEKVGKGCGRVK
jgi:hypothetical protein